MRTSTMAGVTTTAALGAALFAGGCETMQDNRTHRRDWRRRRARRGSAWREGTEKTGVIGGVAGRGRLARRRPGRQAERRRPRRPPRTRYVAATNMTGTTVMTATTGMTATTKA